MANSKCRWECPQQWSQWSEWLAAGLHARNRWRLLVLLMGILFANGRRTVTRWLQAAGISDDYQDYYYFFTPGGTQEQIDRHAVGNADVANLAAVGDAVRPQANEGDDSQVAWLGAVRYQAATGSEAGRMDRSSAEGSGKRDLDCDRRRLHQAAVLATCVETTRHDRRSPAQRRRPERLAAEAEKRATSRPRSAAQIWQAQDQLGRRRNSRGAGQGRSWFLRLLLYRSECQRPRNNRSVRRSCYHRTRLSRCEGGLGFGATTGPQHLAQLGRVQFESVDAHARRIMGLGQESRRTLRSQRLTLGRRRSPPFSRQPSQRPAPAHFTKRIIEHHRNLVVTPKNHPPNQKPHGPGLIANSSSQKVQEASSRPFSRSLLNSMGVRSARKASAWSS